MPGFSESYSSVQEMLLALQPVAPLYCIYPDRYRETARHFLKGFPGRVALPEHITAGDHLEFSRIGAYSLSGRTDFNGYYSERVVLIVSGHSVEEG